MTPLERRKRKGKGKWKKGKKNADEKWETFPKVSGRDNRLP